MQKDDVMVVKLTREQISTLHWAWLEFICDLYHAGSLDFLPDALKAAQPDVQTTEASDRSISIGGDCKDNVISTGDNVIVT